MRWIGLVLALGAAGVLVGWGPEPAPKPPPGRQSATVAWPRAQRADLSAALPDGPLFTPASYLDATTAIGTAPAPSGAEVRLLLRTGTGAPRELRRLSLDGNPQFESFTFDSRRIVWAESNDRDTRVRLWTALRGGGPARLLTADTGNAVFAGNRYDLVIAEGRVHWAAAPGTAEKTTEIRSVALTGGPVTVRTEAGQWSLSAWPWLTDENASRLRTMATDRDTDVVTTGTEQATCEPVWCRVLVLGGPDGLVRIDAMHPDGSGRRRIAGPNAQAAVLDVAVLDRFAILAEPGPTSDLTGTSNLVVADLATGRTVEVARDVDGAFTNGGMLWWSTSSGDDIVWHTLDLRTA